MKTGAIGKRVWAWTACVVMIAGGSAAAEDTNKEHEGAWQTTHVTDRMTSKSAWLAISKAVQPEEPMQAPFDEIKSHVRFGCDAQGEGTVMVFSKEPQLRRTVQDRHRDYQRTSIRTRWDKRVIEIRIGHEPGTAVLDFIDGSEATKLMKESKSVLVEFPWKEEGLVYFDYPLAGSREAIEEAQRNCEALSGKAKGSRRAEQKKAERQAVQTETERRRREAMRGRRELMTRERGRLEHERKAIFARDREEYIGAIMAKVVRIWRRPTGVPPGLKCTVSVGQANNGRGLEVKILQSSGSAEFDRSVEEAVLAALPLPTPRNRAIFDRNIVFLFKPRA